MNCLERDIERWVTRAGVCTHQPKCHNLFEVVMVPNLPAGISWDRSLTLARSFALVGAFMYPFSLTPLTRRSKVVLEQYLINLINSNDCAPETALSQCNFWSTSSFLTRWVKLLRSIAIFSVEILAEKLNDD
ncbi:hypothetical protein YC2023_100943 [Brassica napus]